MDSDGETEVEILKDILGEVRNLNTQLARTDERSRQNRESVETLREDRIVPLEHQADGNEHRSRRNELIVAAALTLASIMLTAGVSYMLGLI